ncbi:probable ubiquitin carboxyl-terminal hydrolase MINDY-4 [Eurytemora carolleeae]|uniref:probable ubiquitin carboxyl-terminal hydrolase MINDY-4 n=1 Tax=Eurytemora carolleeae TaxID=1294199 RepID=UPI000C7713B6|nr:probable ubiquitin carboxyl-terminal hydrolase MINDY-4 [Eurytemora carolleeae]|eukprot:XP_023323183.1 probable ubiquitin carboxyl-terminal hydrolase MINDY-4 [Eurytemora affinis]
MGSLKLRAIRKKLDSLQTEQIAQRRPTNGPVNREQTAQSRHSEIAVIEDQAAQRRQIGSAKLAQQTEQMNTLRLDNWFNNAPEESPDQEQNVFKNEIKESMQLEDVESSLAGNHELDIRPQSTSARQRKILKGSKIDSEKLKNIKELMFGSQYRSYSEGWRNQAFSFENGVESLKFGLVQNKGGPCGVLAVVQAFIIKVLKIGSSMFSVNKGKSVLFPSDVERKNALAAALTEIIYNVSPNKNGPFFVCLTDGGRNSGSSVYLHKDGVSEYMVYYKFSDCTEMYKFVHENLNYYLENGNHALVAFIYSCILTRGVEIVRSDFDSSEGTLLAAHNYCTQELVNLLLIGEAVSNVFDNTVHFSEEIILKGVKRKSAIGFLSLFEHYKSVEVGKNLKDPWNPIWVICSESHFSILFNTDTHADRAKFDLFYYDGLGRQDGIIRLTVNTDEGAGGPLNPYPLEHCIRTRWPGASVDWNGSDPLL